MNGVFGWLMPQCAQSGAGILRVLHGDPSQLYGDSIKAWHVDTAGIAVVDSPRATLLVADPYSLVVFGRPRWMGQEQGEQSCDAVCRYFLESYRVNKMAALESLRGEFALALIDAKAAEVLLSIDRFGIGNLVYQSDERGVIFGSTCDLVCKHPDASRDISPQSIYNYTHFHVVPGPQTIYARQNRMLPGQYVHWSNGRSKIGTYWSMRFSEQSGSVADFKPRFRKVLQDAVATAADDVPCGAFLSGGTDSSTVAGMLGAVTGAQAKTYSIGFAEEGYDEMAYARVASRHFGTQQHEYYVTADDVVDALPMIAAAYDQPFGNASAVAAYYCARLAKSDGVSRMLAGDGGDELFGGNSRYAKQYQFAYYDKVPSFLRHTLEPMLLSKHFPAGIALLRKARSYVEQASRPMPERYDSYNLLDRLGAENLFVPEFLASVDRHAPAELMQSTHKHFRDASLINQMLGIDLKFTLADSDLPKVTRMCELAGVDVAFPLLDERVVEFSALLPAHLKLRGTQLRYFFKEALRDFLPGEILTKQKHGFGLPVGVWITSHPRLSALVKESLASLKGRGFISPVFVDRLLGEHLQAHAAYYGTMAWILMMLELWFQKHAA